MTDSELFSITKIESPNDFDRYSVSGKTPSGHKTTEIVLGITLRNASLYETTIIDDYGKLDICKIIRLFDIYDICHDLLVPINACKLVLDQDNLWYFI
jgi:hypothetical protein